MDGLQYSTDGATTLNLGDDDSREIFFANGNVFTFMGSTYFSVHVGSNGYLTFGIADTSYYVNPFTHYSMPRISALFTDMSPQDSPGGKVSYQQLQSALVVTFENIREYNKQITNTFQVVLTFDTFGAPNPFTIQWAGVDTTDPRTMMVGTGAGSLYSSMTVDSFKRYELRSTAPTECPEPEQPEGAMSVLSAPGTSMDKTSLLAALQSSASSLSAANVPRICPSVSVMNEIAAAQAQKVMGPPPAVAQSLLPPPSSAASSAAVNMPLMLLTCLGATAMMLLMPAA